MSDPGDFNLFERICAAIWEANSPKPGHGWKDGEYAGPSSLERTRVRRAAAAVAHLLAPEGLWIAVPHDLSGVRHG
jgi:hypothetical protein